jgi:formate/nitrite transporter FocA (FNT family)
MKKVFKDISDFSIRCIFGGVLMGFATIAYLVSVIKFNSLIGAILFSFAVLMVFIVDLRLFTGSTALIPETPRKRMWVVPVSFFGNWLGIALVALAVNYSAVGTYILETAQSVASTKMDNGLLSGFITGILCGICLSFAVVATNTAIPKGISPIIFVIFPVVIFIVCGFENSVANLAIFAFAGTAVTWNVFWFFVLVVLGNLIGGPLLLLTQKFSRWAKKEQPQ